MKCLACGKKAVYVGVRLCKPCYERAGRIATLTKEPLDTLVERLRKASLLDVLRPGKANREYVRDFHRAKEADALRVRQDYAKANAQRTLRVQAFTEGGWVYTYVPDLVGGDVVVTEHRERVPGVDEPSTLTSTYAAGKRGGTPRQRALVFVEVHP